MAIARTALILTGGGARAAYQAGVLAAIARLAGRRARNPFPIICGTSAGAINAAGLACSADNFPRAVALLTHVWGNMRAGDIYRADALGIGRAGYRWLSALALGWLTHRAPQSLLDNTPLRTLLQRYMDFSGIGRAIAAGHLHALSISASGYDSGQNISFFEASPEVADWQRAQRIGVRTRLGCEHLLASSAIPFVFPAVRIHREFFGDGSMRQLAPISPAIHLGAEKVLIIGAGRRRELAARTQNDGYPSLAQIAGHALSSIFLDSLAVDIERMERINRTLAAIPPALRAEAGIGLRPLDTLVIAPSQRLDLLAAEHAGALPWPVRALLTGIGAMNRHGGALTSYLLFEKAYTRRLIELGQADTLAQAEAVGQFLEL